MKSKIVYKKDGVFGYCAWPTLARIDENTLAVAFSGNRIHHTDAFGKTMVIYSRDEGKTWSNPVVAVDTDFDDRDGGIVAKGNQVLVSSFNANNANQFTQVEIHIVHNGGSNKILSETDMMRAYVSLNEKADENQVGASISISEDGGLTFSKKVIMPISSPHGPKLLSDGRYVWVGHATNVPERYRKQGQDYGIIPPGLYITFSSDGYNWTKPEKLPGSDDGLEVRFWEPDVIELKNGELLVMARTQKKGEPLDHVIYQTVSHDKITKWDAPSYIGIHAFPPHLMRHSSGKLICSVSKRVGGFVEQVYTSDDEGKTWQGPYDLDDTACDKDMGYPTTVELKDGSLLTAYYHHDEKEQKCYIKSTYWSLDELK